MFNSEFHSLSKIYKNNKTKLFKLANKCHIAIANIVCLCLPLSLYHVDHQIVDGYKLLQSFSRKYIAQNSIDFVSLYLYR